MSVCVHVCTRMYPCVEVRGQPIESVLPFYLHESPGDQTQATSLCELLYPLTHLASP